MSDETEINPLLLHEIDAIVRGISDGLDALWTQPNAAVVVEGFLDGRTALVIERDSITAIARPDEPGGEPQPPAPGLDV